MKLTLAFDKATGNNSTLVPFTHICGEGILETVRPQCWTHSVAIPVHNTLYISIKHSHPIHKGCSRTPGSISQHGTLLSVEGSIPWAVMYSDESLSIHPEYNKLSFFLPPHTHITHAISVIVNSRPTNTMSHPAIKRTERLIA